MSKLLYVACILVVNIVTAQPDNSKEKLLPWLNESIDYTIYHIGMQQLDLVEMTMIPSKYIFVMEELSSAQLESVEKLNYKDWVFLLEDEERGFLIDVLLNYLFEKNITFNNKEDRKEWYYNNKDIIVDEWKLVLTENMPLDLSPQ